VARYDKYEPYAGGFRAPLAVAVIKANGEEPYAVGLNASGQVVLGAGNTGVIGLLITHGAKIAGDIVDVMTHGDVVEFAETGGATPTAGTVYGGAATGGEVSATGAGKYIGSTVEADRLVVRIGLGEDVSV